MACFVSLPECANLRPQETCGQRATHIDAWMSRYVPRGQHFPFLCACEQHKAEHQDYKGYPWAEVWSK